VIQRTVDPTTWLIVTGWSSTRSSVTCSNGDDLESVDNPDPRPGDFDADSAKLDPRYVERHDGDPTTRLMVLVGVEGENAKRLERIAEARGQTAAAVIAQLLSDAERSLA
jgi:hypothetical protein